MIAMDGNDSLKRMDIQEDRTAADTRVLNSDYFLPEEFVNQYAHEVKTARGPQVKTRRPGDVTDGDDEEDLDPKIKIRDVEDDQGDPTDGLVADLSADQSSSEGTSADAGERSSDNNAEQALSAKIRDACVTNWKAAAADEKKKMWSVFDESGIFACACRHGFILWLVDMRRSGEL